MCIYNHMIESLSKILQKYMTYNNKTILKKNLIGRDEYYSTCPA